MATRRSRVPPPRPGQPVPKEYVREQLDILGIKNVSEQEIESYAADLTQLIKDTVLVKRSHTTIPPTEMNRVAPGITMYPPPPTSGLPNTVPAHNTAPGAGLNSLLCSVEGPGITVYPPPPTSGLPNTTPPHAAAGSNRQNVAAGLLCSVEGPGITVYPPPPTSGLPNTTPPHNTTAAAGLNRHNVAPSPLCSVGSAEQHESAVFKTFPGDKENRVQFLSPSLSPSPVQGRRACPNSVSPLSTSLSSREGGRVVNTRPWRGKVVVKRKVLRKCDGESRVFDESISEMDSDVDKPLSRYLSDLSLTSVTSTEGSSQLPGNKRTRCCKSFIRPPIDHPHTRHLKKHDPVNRYHEFQRLWSDFKTPAEQTRHALRWRIREQLLHQDMPYYEPKRRAYHQNDFVVPTDKKRSALRWEVRHALAHQ